MHSPPLASTSPLAQTNPNEPANRPKNRLRLEADKEETTDLREGQKKEAEAYAVEEEEHTNTVTGQETKGSIREEVVLWAKKRRERKPEEEEEDARKEEKVLILPKKKRVEEYLPQIDSVESGTHKQQNNTTSPSTPEKEKGRHKPKKKQSDDEFASFVLQKKEWVRVATLSELEEGKGLLVKVPKKAGGCVPHRELALFLHQSTVHAIQNKCPHAGGPLADGEIEVGDVEDLVGDDYDDDDDDINNCEPTSTTKFIRPPLVTSGSRSSNTRLLAEEDEPKVICPWHAFRFGLRTGKCTKVIMGSPKAKVYPVKIVGNDVYVELTMTRQVTEDF